jgi:hypothetical protein
MSDVATIDDAQLQHLCDLSGVAVSMIRHPDFADEFLAGDRHDQDGVIVCLQILADTVMALMARQGITPGKGVPQMPVPVEMGS